MGDGTLPDLPATFIPLRTRYYADEAKWSFLLIPPLLVIVPALAGLWLFSLWVLLFNVVFGLAILFLWKRALKGRLEIRDDGVEAFNVWQRGPLQSVDSFFLTWEEIASCRAGGIWHHRKIFFNTHDGREYNAFNFGGYPFDASFGHLTQRIQIVELVNAELKRRGLQTRD